jgi:hypothetical protein
MELECGLFLHNPPHEGISSQISGLFHCVLEFVTHSTFTGANAADVFLP